MSLKQFIDGIRFNFINFFAFWIFNVCAGIWIVILFNKTTKDNPHVAEIRTACQTIVVLVIGYFFGSSKLGSKKDEVIQQVIDSNTKKDEAIKTLTDDAKDK